MLASYVDTYLKEEIAAEALVKNIGAFSRFLEVSGSCHGQMINYASIGCDAQVASNTIREYFQILYDTLIARELPSFLDTTKRKPISKFCPMRFF